MPAILRIFPYQTLASLTDIGSKPSYDQGAVGSGHELVCNNMPCGPSSSLNQLDSVAQRRRLSSLWLIRMS